MKIISLIALMIMTCVITTSAQVIWIEDFSTHPTGTTIDPGRWTATTAGHCDGETLPSAVAGNFWGVDATTQEFRCNDIEGTTCCGTTGASNNIWITNSIPIGGYANISISIDSRVIGAVECAACGSGGDLFIAAYSIDGGAFVNFDTICGAASGFNNSDCIDVGSGANLVIRVTLGNQANDENYYFDNVIVDATPCNPLPVELESFQLNCSMSGSVIAKWTTSAEVNNSHFFIEGSLDAINYYPIKRIEGNGNSNVIQTYNTEFENTLLNNYFHLVQYDYNGNNKIYNPLYLVCHPTNNTLTTSFNNGILNINIPTDEPNTYLYKIHDLSGKVILEGFYYGQSTLHIPIQAPLATGLYLIQVLDQSTGIQYNSKFYLP